MVATELWSKEPGSCLVGSALGSSNVKGEGDQAARDMMPEPEVMQSAFQDQLNIPSHWQSLA